MPLPLPDGVLGGPFSPSLKSSVEAPRVARASVSDLSNWTYGALPEVRMSRKSCQTPDDGFTLGLLGAT